MVCTFLGHKDASEKIKEKIETKIFSLVQEGVKLFLVGNNGYFDYTVQSILENISSSKKDIKYYIVLSKINEKAINNAQSSTIFPEGLELVPPKFAISKRNEWLIKNSNIAVVYVTNKHSNCYKWVEKALSRGLRIISIN